MDNKILDICVEVLKITDEEIEDMRMVIDGQKNYISPLRPVTQGRQNALGRHNEKALDKLLELKAVLETGAEFEEE